MPSTRASGHPAPFPLPVIPGDARRALKTMLTGTKWCRHVDAVVLAVHEALTNAERHGGGVVAVHASVVRGALVVEVCDRGPGFDLSRAIAEEPLAEHGRGLCLMRQIASRVETDWDGPDFCLRLRFDPP